MLKPFRKQAYWLIVFQAAIVGLLFFVWLVFRDINSGFSTILGGSACIIPSLYFIKKVFSPKKRTPQKIIRDFYLGEMVKLLLSAALLVLILKFIPVKIVPLLSGYIGAYLAIWILPLALKDK